MSTAKTPRTVGELTCGYLSRVAAKLLSDPAARVTSFTVTADPFEFPRFGDKEFYEIAFEYRGRNGSGRSTVILRVLPPMDAALPDETNRLILSHLAAFHAAFWERHDILRQTWLMRLEQPVDYFYRCVVDVLDGMKAPAESSTYIVGKWPWFAEGVVNLMDSLAPKTRRAIEGLYRQPERLLEKIRHLPRTLCHYDFDNRNLGLRETPEGAQTVVIDWEIVGEGLSSADVGRFLAYQQPSNVEALVGYYLDELERNLGRPIDREAGFPGCGGVSRSRRARRRPARRRRRCCPQPAASSNRRPSRSPPAGRSRRLLRRPR